MIVCHRRGLSGCVAVLAVLGVDAPAQAQTASQITPPSYAPPTQRPGASLTIPSDTGTTAPEGSDRVEVTLGGVAVEGVSVDGTTLARLRARLTAGRIKVSDIFAAAHALEVEYARSGHVLTRVVVPAQELADGATLRLVIVEGFIERVDTDHVPGSIAGKVTAILTPLVGKPGVTQGRIERALLLAADLPGARLTSTLAAGSAPGATVLVIGASQTAVTGFVTFDNSLPEALGRGSVGLGVDINSVLGLGEQVYLRASGLPALGRETSFLDPTPRNRALAAGAIVPIGHDGLMLNVEATDARTAPRHDASLPGFGSRFRRVSGRLRYPLVRTRALTIRAETSFDAQDERVRIISPAVLPLSLDRLRIARIAGEVAGWLPGGGVVTARVQGSFGIDGLGARSAADATATLPLSRQGSDAGFHKLEAQATLDQPILRPLELGVRARAQTSFGEVMANAEQIGIATLDGISPLPSGTLQGDRGYVVRGELRARLPLALTPAFASIAPYGFGAIGGVAFEQPTALERRTTAAAAWGAGLRLSGAARDGRPGLSASIEYGRAHVAGTDGHPSRFSFTTVIQF